MTTQCYVILDTWNPLDSSVGNVVRAVSENHGEMGNAAYLLLESHCSQFPSVLCCWQGWSGQDDLPDYVYEGVLPPLPSCAPGVPPAQQASHLCGWPLSACRWVGETVGVEWKSSLRSEIACAIGQSWHYALCAESWAQAPASLRELVCPKPPLHRL